VAEFTAEGGHGAVPTDPSVPTGLPADPDHGAPVDVHENAEGADGAAGQWPLFEVFLRGKRGLNHVHVGSLHAADARMALRHARDLYTRRNEGVSIWVVASADITASSPTEKDPFFAPSGDKVYRHPTFYVIPENVPHI
jgi:ring-1,2-phenylacetyl-CoA epoxidase subunit PaaB